MYVYKDISRPWFMYVRFTQCKHVKEPLLLQFKIGSVKFLPKLGRSSQGALVFKHLLAYLSHL